MPTYTMSATVTDTDRARQAVEALSLKGVDGRRIRLEPPAEDPRPASREQVRAADRGSARILLLRAAAGGVVGAVLGATAGGVLGWWLVPDGDLARLAALVVSLAVACAGLGAVVGLQTVPTMAPAWDRAGTMGRQRPHRLVVEEVDEPDLAEVRLVLMRAGHLEDTRRHD
jgi:hypothetical protein